MGGFLAERRCLEVATDSIGGGRGLLTSGTGLASLTVSTICGAGSGVSCMITSSEGTAGVFMGTMLLLLTCDGKCGGGTLRGACMVIEGDVNRRRNLRFRLDSLPEPSILTK